MAGNDDAVLTGTVVGADEVGLAGDFGAWLSAPATVTRIDEAFRRWSRV
jgi:hypothetical protein